MDKQKLLNKIEQLMTSINSIDSKDANQASQLMRLTEQAIQIRAEIRKA